MNYTPKQLRVMEFLRDFFLEHGVSPTLDEIAREMGVTKPTAFGHVEALLRKGAIVKSRSRARSVEIRDPRFLRPPQEEAGDASRPVVPVEGQLRGDRAIDGPDSAAEVDLRDFLPWGRPCFALRVHGNGLQADGLKDGDHVILERRVTAREGETVMARLEGGERVLRRYFPETHHVRLESTGDEGPLRVPRCEIQGVVVSVLRSFG